MAYRCLSTLPTLLGSTALGTAFGAAAHAVPGAVFAASKAIATAATETAPASARPGGLPPPWEPPAHNPTTLKPKPVPTLPEILATIRQARDPMTVHNAYRRKNGSLLPPPVAAAMLSRVAELSQRLGGVHIQHGLKGLSHEVGRSWYTLLHLFSARDLAVLVRASGELGLLRKPSPELWLWICQAASPGAASGRAADGAAAGSGDGSGSGDDGLLRRSLDVLLGDGGAELAEAGPQAVLDVSYGLMLMDHEDAATWRTLGPLLRSAEAQLQAGGGGAAGATPVLGAEVAGRVRAWLRDKRL